MGCMMLVALPVLFVYMGVFAAVMLGYLVIMAAAIALYMSVFAGYLGAFFMFLFL